MVPYCSKLTRSTQVRHCCRVVTRVPVIHSFITWQFDLIKRLRKTARGMSCMTSFIASFRIFPLQAFYSEFGMLLCVVTLTVVSRIIFNGEISLLIPGVFIGRCRCKLICNSSSPRLNVFSSLSALPADLGAVARERPCCRQAKLSGLRGCLVPVNLGNAECC